MVWNNEMLGEPQNRMNFILQWTHKCSVSRTYYFANVTVRIIQLTLDSNGKLSPLNGKGRLKLASSTCKNVVDIFGYRMK